MKNVLGYLFAGIGVGLAGCTSEKGETAHTSGGADANEAQGNTPESPLGKVAPNLEKLLQLHNPERTFELSEPYLRLMSEEGVSDRYLRIHAVGMDGAYIGSLSEVIGPDARSIFYQGAIPNAVFKGGLSVQWVTLECIQGKRVDEHRGIRFP